MAEPLRPPCPTCGCPWSAEDFYASSTECRPCKRERSQLNRLTAARKIALAERFTETLARVVDQGGHTLAPCQWISAIASPDHGGDL